MLDDGVDLDRLEDILKTRKIKLFYTVPNFQNPSGITLSLEKRKALGKLLEQYGVILIEDDPYGELRFIGEDLTPVRAFTGNHGILLGSFSKIVAPGFRLGWVWANPTFMDKLITVKQATDLHTNFFSQRVVESFLSKSPLKNHLDQVRKVYGIQRNAMVNCIDETLGDSVTITRPEGGMFLWMTLPEKVSSLELFDLAIKKNVAFVPGLPFYVRELDNCNTLRLNFSNSSPEVICEGINRLTEAYKELQNKSSTAVLQKI